MYKEVLRKPVFDHKHPRPLIGVRHFTVNHLFANVWSRSSDAMIGDGISLRERRLITIALLAAQGRTDQLQDHLLGARRSGLKSAELFEVMIQVAHYAGWAAGSSGQSTVQKVFAKKRPQRVGHTTKRRTQRTQA
jgi:alkylhydroperoxidase/carboxymuconolactone decarboxylase family protein YurZ